MNADEVLRALKECGDCDNCPYYSCWIDEETGDPADACNDGRLFKDILSLIESLQAQLKLEHGGALAAAENCLRLQGEVNDLQAQLAIARRRAEKAVADLKYIAVCETCKKSGVTEYPESAVIQCEYYDSESGCNKYEWRAEDGENETTVAYFTLCKDNELGYVYKCASCGNEMYGYIPKYCSECGKRIVEGDDE